MAGVGWTTSNPSPGHQVTTIIASPPFTGSPRRRFASRSDVFGNREGANRGRLQLGWVELDQVGLRVT